jgi:selenocysteine-specific elongation factor
MPLTVGTAGHIDHGKTWLVRALTGKDTDRLPEERERGISIDLGYAPLVVPGRVARLSLIDVPGHERFIRNMVAGATGVDLFLLVIDAAEGVRPQTREHLAILRLLGIETGVVAVTKADAVDEETLELAVDEARELVPGAAVVPVSAKTGLGLDALRAALAVAADRAERPRPEWGTRLCVDRAFSLRGIGTVVTGTLWSGRIADGDELRLEPAGVDVRVRSVQVHDQPVTVAEAGQRVAVSLPGVERAGVRRGDVIVEPGTFPVSYRLDVALEELEPIAGGTRLHVHHGTGETPARLVREGRFAQLRLARPVVAARGDRVVLRGETTLGGGVVLDPAPPRGLGSARLEILARGEPGAIVEAIVEEPVTVERLRRRGLLAPGDLAAGLSGLERAGDWHFSAGWLERARAAAHERLAERARTTPLDPGLSVPELLPRRPWATAIAPLLGLDRRDGKLYLPGVAASLGGRAAAAERLEVELREAGANPIRVEDRALAEYLEREGRLVRVGDGYAVGRDAFEQARAALVQECERAGTIRLARFRDLLGIGRRSAQVLLERFDADGLTRRVGEERVLRRGAVSRPEG